MDPEHCHFNDHYHNHDVTVVGSVCSFCVCLCVWTRSLCLSALSSTAHLCTEVIWAVTGVARLHCLYLAGVSVVGCQIVIALVVSYSLCQSSCSWVSSRLVAVRYSWRVRTGLNSLPELETLRCRVYCTCTTGLSAPPLCLESVPALPGYLHLHCVLELDNKDCLFHSQLDLEFLYRDTWALAFKINVKSVNNVPSFTISSCRRGDQSRITDTVITLVCVSKQAAVVWPCLPLPHTHTTLRCVPLCLSLAPSFSHTCAHTHRNN